MTMNTLLPALVITLLIIAAITAALPPTAVTRAGLPADHIQIVGVSAGPARNPRADLTQDRIPCTRIEQGEKHTVSVYTSEIPADRGISAFEVRLTFDPSIVNVTAVDYQQLLSQAPESELLEFGETDSDSGQIILAAGDFGGLGIEPDGPSEVGPGALALVELTAVGEGTSDLAIATAVGADDLNLILHARSLHAAAIAVNTDCPEGPSQPTTGAGGQGQDEAPWPEIGIVLAVTAAFVVGGLALVFRLD
jgi:hypothetical protein